MTTRKPERKEKEPTRRYHVIYPQYRGTETVNGSLNSKTPHGERGRGVKKGQGCQRKGTPNPITSQFAQPTLTIAVWCNHIRIFSRVGAATTSGLLTPLRHTTHHFWRRSLPNDPTTGVLLLGLQLCLRDGAAANTSYSSSPAPTVTVLVLLMCGRASTGCGDRRVTKLQAKDTVALSRDISPGGYDRHRS